MMNTILLQGTWHILKGKLKQTWALLTGDDLDYQDGKAEEFLGRIQKKTGEKRAAIKKARRECEELWEQIDPASKGEAGQKLQGVIHKELCCSL